MTTKTSKPFGINKKLKSSSNLLNHFSHSSKLTETKSPEINYSQKVQLCNSTTLGSKVELAKRKGKFSPYKNRPHPLNLQEKGSNCLMSLKTPDASIVSGNFSETFMETLTPTNTEILRKYSHNLELDGPSVLKLNNFNSLETPKKITCNTPTDKTPELGLFDRSNSRSSSGNHFTFPLSNKSSDNSEKRDSPPASPTFQPNVLKRPSDEEFNYNRQFPDKIAKLIPNFSVKNEVEGNNKIIELNNMHTPERLSLANYNHNLLSEDRNSSNENNSFLSSSNDSMAAMVNFKTRIDPLNTSIHDNKYDHLTTHHQSTIPQTTMPNLQNNQLNLQVQSQQKLDRKRERNREAAKRCRERKIQKITELEQQVAVLEKKLGHSQLERDYYKVKCNKIVEVVNHYITRAHTKVPIPAISCIIQMTDTDELANLNYEAVVGNTEVQQDSVANRLSNATSLNGSLSSSMTDIQQNELERNNTEISSTYHKVGLSQNHWPMGANIPLPTLPPTVNKSHVKQEADADNYKERINNVNNHDVRNLNPNMKMSN